MLLTKGLMLSEENVTNLDYINKKIILVFVLTTFVLLLLLGFTDILLGMSSVIGYINIVLSFVFLLGYFLISKYGKAELGAHILLVVGHILVFINFQYNDGSNGPTIYAFFLFLVVFSLVLIGKSKVVWFVSSMIFFFLMFWAETYGYLKVEHFYVGAERRFLDHITAIMWISIFMFIVLNFFIKSYQNQNRLLNSIKLRQEEILLEVKTLNDQKNRLIALLSHDLKNPIGMLHSTLDLVDEDAIEPDELEFILQNLRQQSYHLNKLLNNTLTWVMTELENRPNEVLQISLAEITWEMKDMMMLQAQDKDQKIEVTIAGEDRVIALEPSEVKIILKNFLDNAIKFSAVESSIFFCLIISDTYIKWEVINFGPTISQKDQGDLFTFRARTSYGTKKEKGTGIGLPLCMRIAEKIGYEISYSIPQANKNCFSLSKSLS